MQGLVDGGSSASRAAATGPSEGPRRGGSGGLWYLGNHSLMTVVGRPLISIAIRPAVCQNKNRTVQANIIIVQMFMFITEGYGAGKGMAGIRAL